jgi:hypothetical protein
MVSLQLSTVHVLLSVQFTGGPAEQQCARSLKSVHWFGLPSCQVQTSSPLQNAPSLQIAGFGWKVHALNRQTLLVQKFRSSH